MTYVAGEKNFSSKIVNNVKIINFKKNKIAKVPAPHPQRF